MNIFVVLSVAPKIVQVWGEKAPEEKAPEEKATTQYVAPMSTKKFLDLPATSICTLGSSPMFICDRRAGMIGPLQSC